MNHSFNVKVAVDFSVNIALFLEHLKFWTFKNLANKSNIYDGKCWSYDTIEALADYFPYWTKSQRETVINSAVAAGLVVKGNYNKTKFDRTVWYALTETAYGYFPELMAEKYLQTLYSSVSENSEMDFLTFGNLFPKNRTPIPDTQPGTDPNTKDLKDIADSPNTAKTRKTNSWPKNYKDCERFMAFYDSYPKHVDPGDAYKAFRQVIGLDDNLLAEILADIALRKEKHSQWRDKQFIKYPAVYLRKGEYLGEIINDEAEKQKKMDEQKRLAEERVKAQEEASQKRAKAELANNHAKQADAIVYRETTAKALADIKKSLGM